MRLRAPDASGARLTPLFVKARLPRRLVDSHRTNGAIPLMAHKFQIKKNKAGEFVAYFVYNSETIFWTEGYASKASAKNAIESIQKNGPAAEIDDQTD